MTPSDASRRAPRPTPPGSTYRFQFHVGFGFDDAAGLSDYLRDLGITHAYASPYLRATPGSTHGYDVVDHSQVNPELGGADARERWVHSLRQAGLSHILDIVPNHMGVATDENAWWNDLLEYGPQSRCANHFDIAWNGTANAPIDGKVMLPVLGEPYGTLLRGDAFQVVLDSQDGRLWLRYGGRRFPLTPASYASILGNAPDAAGEASGDPVATGESIKAALRQRVADPQGRATLEAAVRQFNNVAGDEGAAARHALLEAQPYRLAHWRSANGTINYRRFFDVDALAALKMEQEEVFDDAHRLVIGWVKDGSVSGLRIDHPDGLADPARYFQRLADATGGTYVVAEKILGENEPLRRAWPVDGTSGYEFLNYLNGLFVDPSRETEMDIAYQRFVGHPIDYHALARINKRRVCDETMSSELNLLAERLHRIALSSLETRDLGFLQLRTALRELTACFPIYRTYSADAGPDAADEAALDASIDLALAQRPRPDEAALRFVRSVVMRRDETARQFTQRLQQFTAPVMAKGVEDTTFYQYNRLLSLCEVGGEPSRFGIEPEVVHAFLADRQRHWPGALSVLSTHDTKRSEDVRARINVLSEIPGLWSTRLARWAELNHPHRTGNPLPDRNFEYAIYQLLIGAWPEQGDERRVDPQFAERFNAVVLKSMREAKVFTSWLDPNPAYEEAVKAFVAGLLDSQRGGPFLADFVPFQAMVARVGFINSIAQTVLKLAAPGVPDTYQGTEVIDLSLVDPDNRRPVDYRYRQTLLGEPLPAGPATSTRDRDRLKLHVHRSLLQLRRDRADLFRDGAYQPVRIRGPRAAHLFAFERVLGEQRVLVAVPRLMAQAKSDGLEPAFGDAGWRDTTIEARGYTRELLTGAALDAGDAFRLDGALMTTLQHVHAIVLTR